MQHSTAPAPGHPQLPSWVLPQNDRLSIHTISPLQALNTQQWGCHHLTAIPRSLLPAQVAILHPRHTSRRALAIFADMLDQLSGPRMNADQQRAPPAVPPSPAPMLTISSCCTHQQHHTVSSNQTLHLHISPDYASIRCCPALHCTHLPPASWCTALAAFSLPWHVQHCTMFGLCSLAPSHAGHLGRTGYASYYLVRCRTLVTEAVMHMAGRQSTWHITCMKHTAWLRATHCCVGLHVSSPCSSRAQLGNWCHYMRGKTTLNAVQSHHEQQQ
jgi:hypothetical protein